MRLKFLDGLPFGVSFTFDLLGWIFVLLFSDYKSCKYAEQLQIHTLDKVYWALSFHFVSVVPKFQSKSSDVLKTLF